MYGINIMPKNSGTRILKPYSLELIPYDLDEFNLDLEHHKFRSRPYGLEETSDTPEPYDLQSSDTKVLNPYRLEDEVGGRNRPRFSQHCQRHSHFALSPVGRRVTAQHRVAEQDRKINMVQRFK